MQNAIQRIVDSVTLFAQRAISVGEQ